MEKDSRVEKLRYKNARNIKMYHKKDFRKSVATDLCIDTKFRKPNEIFGLEKCIKDDINQKGEQQFVLSWHKDIRPLKRNFCFDVSSSEKFARIVLWNCHGMQGNQLWKYDLGNLHLIHLIIGNCLDCSLTLKEIYMSPCDRNKLTQKWKFEFVNVTAIINW